jgi:hypothetical protein
MNKEKALIYAQLFDGNIIVFTSAVFTWGFVNNQKIFI